MPSSLPVKEWTKRLSKNPDAEATAPVGKALEEYSRAEGSSDPRARIATLQKVIAAAKAAKKANAKKKDVVGDLDELLVDADKELTRAAKEPLPGEEEDEEGEELNAQLKRVKKLEVEKARPFVLALGQVPGLVVASRPPVTCDDRNTAREMRTGRGKLVEGRCYGEGGKYVFEMEEKPAGGLTKLIKKAAKVHAGMDIRLLVRGGGVDLDDQNDLEEMTEFGSESDEKKPTPPTTADPGPSADDELRTEWERTIAEAGPRLQEAVRRFPEKADAIEGIVALATGRAEAGDYARALDTLERLDGLLTPAPSAADGRAGGPVQRPPRRPGQGGRSRRAADRPRKR